MTRSTESVTVWLADLKQGHEDAAGKIWRRYLDRLLRLARRKLGAVSRRAADEEDVVVSAFDAFLRGIHAGRFQRLDDRDDLWQVLVMLTERQAVSHRRRELAEKRGAGGVRGESVFIAAPGSGEVPAGIAGVVADPTPEFAERFGGVLAEMMDVLPDEVHRRIVLGKLEGLSNKEIADRLGLGLRSVERKLGIIRDRWRAGQDA